MGKQRDRKIIDGELKAIVIEDEAKKAEFDELADNIIFGSAEDFVATLEKTLLSYNGFEHDNPIYDQVVYELSLYPLAQ